MKKFFLALFVIASLNGKILDKVIASVNNLPITSYDLQNFMQQHNIKDKNVALNQLVDQKVVESQIKSLGIDVEDYEIEDFLSKIAHKNGMNLFEFKTILTQRGELKKLKAQIKQNLLRKKLYDAIIGNKLKIDDVLAKEYYKSHKDDFSVFKSVQVTKYSANNPQALKLVQQNPLAAKNVKFKTEVFNYQELPLNLLFLFKNTKEGEFTPIVNDGMNYVTYFVARKDGKIVMPFEKVKNLIYNQLAEKKRNQILQDYFNRLKSQMDIKFYN